MKKLIALSLVTFVSGIVPIHAATIAGTHGAELLEKPHSHSRLAHKSAKKLSHKKSARVHKHARKTVKRQAKHKAV
jgi:hypothetical protein